MNIIFVSSEYPQTPISKTGGIGTYLQNLIYGLTKKNHKVFLVTRGNIQTNGKFILIKCNWGMRLENAFAKLNIKILQRFIKFLSYPVLFQIESFLKVRKIVNNNRIDIIEGNDFGGELILFKFLTKEIPIVIRLHTPLFVIQKFNEEKDNLFYKIVRFFELRSLNNADYMYSPTKSLKNIINKYTNKKNIKVIPYPFSSLIKNPADIHRKKIILYVGKLQNKKGVFTLLKAIPRVIRKFKKANFIFIGPDTFENGKSIKEKMVSYIQNNKIGNFTSIYNSLNKDNLYKFYYQSSLLIIPSLWENFPNVCLEAMASNLCVIAANSGGLSEIIKDRFNGLLFKANNSLDLSNKIILLLNNEKLRMFLTKNAYKTVRESYDLNKITQDTVNYYQKCIDSY